MLPGRFKTKEAAQLFFFYASIICISQAALGQTTLELEADLNDEGLEDDFDVDVDQASIDPIGETGAGLLAYSLFNLAIGPRNAYNQIPKSSDWFKTALTWPDRWFRHAFRCSDLCLLSFLSNLIC